MNARVSRGVVKEIARGRERDRLLNIEGVLRYLLGGGARGTGGDRLAEKSRAEHGAPHRLASHRIASHRIAMESDNSRRARPSLRCSSRTKGLRARVRRFAPPRAHDRGRTT